MPPGPGEIKGGRTDAQLIHAEDVVRGLGIYVSTRQVVEVRAFAANGVAYHAFYDTEHLDQLAGVSQVADVQERFSGVYFTPNPVRPDKATQINPPTLIRARKGAGASD